jgi:hypothetical protein
MNVVVAVRFRMVELIQPIKKTNASLPLEFRFGNANTWAGKMNDRKLEEWAPEAAEQYRKVGRRA